MDEERDGWMDRGMEGLRKGRRDRGREGTDERNFSIFYSDGVNQVSRFCLSQIQTAEF